MRAADYLSLDDEALIAQCEVHTFRASGPGGQKRNKTSSAVRLHHRPTALIAKAVEDRSQHVNKRRALRRLRLLLATELLEDVDLPTYAPDALIDSSKDAAGRLHWRPRAADGPLVINEILSLLHSAAGQPRVAAGCLGITTSNLLRILESEPRVWRKANWIRQCHGLKALSAHG